MASSRAIKNRIKSTKSIQQITKAMEAVSAVKMRKTESAAFNGRPFALYALQILKNIESNIAKLVEESSFFDKKEVEKGLLVVIASDKGLAGSFNSNIFKASSLFIKNSKYPLEVLTVGKKSKEFFEKSKIKINSSFVGAGDFVEIEEVKEITNKIIELFKNNEYQKVDVIYTNFISALKQEVVHRPLLPLNEENIKTIISNIIPETGKFSDLKAEMQSESADFKFEPGISDASEILVPLLVEIEIFHSLLEANASEHAARMVAMRSASDNAKEVIGSLTISYNKARQAQITKELIEIVSGKEALANTES